MPAPATEATLYRWTDIPAEPLSPTLTRQFLSGAQCMMARIVLTKGCIVPRHSHPNEQIAFILSGSLRFTLGADPATADIKTVNTGEILVIPADLPHSAVALEDTIDFDLFAPPREDWIRGDDAYLRHGATPE